MRVLLVAPFPPRRDGIAAYAAVQASRLRERGDAVAVLSPPDGDGDLRAPFHGGAVFRRAARVGGGYDRILVHFQPSLYFAPRAPLSKVATAASLLWLCARRRGRTDLLVHEADPPVRWRPDYVLLALAFRAARVLVHTEAELSSLRRRYGRGIRGAVVPHGDGVRVRPVTRAAARRELEIAPDVPLFVSPGFLHPDKGFDRAIAAVERLDGARLVIVGSVREPLPANVAYASRLRRAAADAPRAELRETFVDDSELDAWIAAADAVVLPYRRSWSSGMLARAQALGTPGIVAAVGGLPDQAGEADIVVEDDAALVEAMRAVVAGRSRPAVAEGAG